MGPESRRHVTSVTRMGPDASLRRGPACQSTGADPCLRRGADRSLRIVKPEHNSDDESN